MIQYCCRALNTKFSGRFEIDGCCSFCFVAGVARGSGWQHLGAYVNLGAYYLVGIPVSLLLGFVCHFRGKGLWSGLIAGSTVQASLLVFITFRTDWKKQVCQ